MQDDTLHPSTVRPSFLSEQGQFGFQLMDPGHFDVAVLDQGFAANEHGDSHDADDVDHRSSNGRSSVLGQSQGLDIFFTDICRQAGSRKSLTGESLHREGATEPK